jgi:hypothetical protein
MEESKELGQIIARRIIKTPDGKTLEVRMGIPRPYDGATGDSYCPVQIVGALSDRVIETGGVDSFQAIQLALRIVGTNLALLNAHEYDGKLEWLESGDPDLGFPLPDVLNLPELLESKREDVSSSVERHNARNAELSKLLLSKKVDLAAPRKCDFHFWAKDRDCGSKLMKYLCSHFFEPQALNLSANGSDWNVEVSRVIPPEVVLDQKFSQYLVAIAAIFDSVYDGWGTSV